MVARRIDLDDEVALLHSPEPPYTAVSEPLVHIRYYLQSLESEGMLEPSAAADVLADLKGRWYGERTLPTLVTLLQPYLSEADHARAMQLIADFRRFRLKSHDLVAFIEGRTWAAAS